MSVEYEATEQPQDPSRTIVIVGQGLVPPPPTSCLKAQADLNRGVQTDLDLDSLADDEIADAIPHLLVDYAAECKDWTTVAGEHWKKGRWGRVDEILNAGVRCKLPVRGC
jgi:RNA polymerase-associated protein CTR9